MKNFYIFFIAFLISGLGFGQDNDTSVTLGSVPFTEISSLVDNPGAAVPVFEFAINDQGTADVLPTKITSIRLKKGSSGNGADWLNTIEGVTLTRDVGGAVTLNSVTVNSTSIDISIDSGNLDIPDGESRTITVAVYLKSTGIIDNTSLAFFIDDIPGEITVDNIGSSLIATPSSDLVGNSFTIEVIATQLTFITQPTNVTVGQVMPAVEVGVTDENENVDVDSDMSIRIFSSGSNIFPGSTLFVPAEGGVATFDDLIFLTQANNVQLIAEDPEENVFFSTPFDVTILPSQTTYTYTAGTWSPIDPSGVSESIDKIVIASGDAHITADTFIYDVVVQPGASLTVDTGVTLRVIDNLTLDSQSNSYSSFIYNGVPTNNFTNSGLGTVVGGPLFYNRFVNSQANGNDLIAPPFENQSWSNFLSLGTNATDLFNDGNTGPTTYLFGPFSQSAESYILWTDDLDRDLGPGTGYRAATYDDTAASGSGTTLTFSGNLRTTPVELSLLFNAGTLFADWNLIGNPYTAHVNLDTLLDYDIDANTKNIDLIAVGAGIYAYDGDASDGWDIITLDNASSRLLTPGQGFLLPAAVSATTILSDKFTFDPSMRISGNSDDFISGRNAVLTFLKMKAYTATKSYNTQFYFNETSSLGIDHGYDGKILGATPSFALYSNAVMDETQLPLGLQSLNLSALENTTIPLGVKSNAGEQITFSITESTLPASVEVYLEDTVTNTFTLLNTGDYTITPTTNLNGTGRFYLRLGDTALSTTDTTLDALQIYTDYKAGNLVISGNLTEATSAKVYDIEGRLVNTTQLTATSQTQTIDMSSLSAGVYVVQLANRTQSKTQKVIWR